MSWGQTQIIIHSRRVIIVDSTSSSESTRIIAFSEWYSLQNDMAFHMQNIWLFFHVKQKSYRARSGRAEGSCYDNVPAEGGEKQFAPLRVDPHGPAPCVFSALESMCTVDLLNWNSYLTSFYLLPFVILFFTFTARTRNFTIPVQNELT